MKIKYIFGLLLSAVSISSCDLMSDIDSIKPQYQLEEDNYVTNAKNAEQALLGVYQDWRSWGISTVRLHMSVMAGCIQTTGGISGITGFNTNSVDPDNTAIADLYSGLYTVINTANYLIEALQNNQASDLDAVRKEEIVGECKFHRALAHFMLLRHFGQFYDETSTYGIVLRKEPYRPDTPISSRFPVADCYTFILQDLTDAIQSCPETVSSHAYVSRLTAKGLKAKVLLCQKNYPEAAQVAQEVITESSAYGYQLEYNNWGQIFYDNYLSSETLFAPYTKGWTEQCFINIDRTTHTNYDTQLSRKWAAKTDRFTHDPRYTSTFAPATSATGNGKFPYNSYSDDIGNGYIFMRLAEVFLIQAEAEARQGKDHYSNARKSLKVITDRAGYPEDLVNQIPDNELLEAIREHKWLELATETGEEWFDLVRYTVEGDVAWGSVQPTLLSKWQLILPIPQKAMTGNKLLEQNPEY